MDNKKLVAICRHELRLEKEHDIARLIQEVKRLQADSSDTYARLTKKHRINAREILSGYMLAWEYVEDLDGLRLWSGKTCRPDALFWPEDKKKILAGVEQLFNEFQDYGIIDRQKRKLGPILENSKEVNAGANPSPSMSQSTTRPPTERTSKREMDPKTGTALVPVAQDTELHERASGLKVEPRKAVNKGSYDLNPKMQLEGSVDAVSTRVSPFKKRALTPPYIPEKGLLQTWPGFKFEIFNEEGSRASRKRTKKIYDSEKAPVIALRSGGLRMTANRKQKPSDDTSSPP